MLAIVTTIFTKCQYLRQPQEFELLMSEASLLLKILVVIITTMNSRLVIKKLEQEGWILSRVRGSHHQFKHPTRPGLITVKHPDKDIPIGTLRSIHKQAGWV